MSHNGRSISWFSSTDIGELQVLARTTKPTEPSPQVQQSRTPRANILSKEEPFERDPDLPRPRLSVPIDDDDDDDSFQLAPPRLSEPLADDYTQRSIEAPRRAISEQPANRIARESFGVLRLSDRFADINELDSDVVSDPGNDDDAAPDFDEQDYRIDHSAAAEMNFFE